MFIAFSLQYINHLIGLSVQLQMQTTKEIWQVARTGENQTKLASGHLLLYKDKNTDGHTQT